MNKKIEFIQKNYTWIIGIFTVITVIVSHIFKFTEYIKCSYYFSFYGLDINLYKYSDKGFIYSLCLSALFIFAFVSLLYCFYQMVNSIENIKMNKETIKNILCNLVIVVIANLFLFLFFKLEWKFYNVLVLLIIELIGTCIMFGSKNKNNDLSYEKIINFLKKLSFLIIILIILYGCKTVLELGNKKDYRIIDDNKVIVYTSNNYYLTLDCKVNNDELTIYKGTQEKISNVNVYSKYTKFKKVHIIKN